jgi:hypothetical protein
MMGSDYWHPHWGNHSSWEWALKFAWLPAKMDNGEFVWWKKYYHGVRFIHVPAGEGPVTLHQYVSVEEFIWRALTQS